MNTRDFLADYESRLTLREQNNRIARRAEWAMVALFAVVAMCMGVWS